MDGNWICFGTGNCISTLRATTRFGLGWVVKCIAQAWCNGDWRILRWDSTPGDYEYPLYRDTMGRVTGAWTIPGDTFGTGKELHVGIGGGLN